MNYKRIFEVAFVMLLIIVMAVTPVLAAKPQAVITRSNGFPSGMHFNLNIHGMDPAVFDCSAMTAGGNSIYVPILGSATIQYVSNSGKTTSFADGASPYELYVLDPCAVADGLAKVYLPTKVAITDDSGNTTYQDAGGYFVFGRILGKPNNGGGGAPSSMILSQNIVYQACDDAGEDAMDCELALGLIVGNNLYGADDEQYFRFATSDGGKGKSMATDITRLFLYTGWVYWGEDPDTNGDEDLTEADFPPEFSEDPTDLSAYPGIDLNGNGTVEICEWALYHPDIDHDGDVDADDAAAAEAWILLPCAGITLADIDTDEDGHISLAEWQAYQVTLGHAQYFENEWIFNIAELVVTSQGIQNFGATLVQIRFYPMNFTSFTPDPADYPEGGLP
jgi:hypothetical protein